MNRRLLKLDLVVALITFVVYALTHSATITWQHSGADGGDLVTAAFTLGVPHPTGYPLYTMLSALVSRIPLGEPAGNLAFLSALTSALAVFFLLRAMRILTAGDSDTNASLIAPVSASLIFAFAPLVWSQSVIPEVYALNLLLVAVVLWGLVSKHAVVAVFALGMGLAHHLSIIFIIPLALWYLLRVRTRPTFTIAITFIAPLLSYLYLPLRASLDPPVNWGDASTFDGFAWMLGGAAYRQYFFNITLADLFQRTDYVARLTLDNLGLAGVAFALFGMSRLYARDRSLALAFLSTVLLIGLYSVFYVSQDSYIYLIPAFALLACFMAVGMASAGALLRSKAWQNALVGLYLLVPLTGLAIHWERSDVSRDFTARDYATGILARVPSDAIVFADADDHLFALWYARYVLDGDSSRVSVVNPALLQFDWYWKQARNRMSDVEEAGDSVTRAAHIIQAGQYARRAIFFTYYDTEILRGRDTNYDDGLYQLIRKP